MLSSASLDEFSEAQKAVTQKKRAQIALQHAHLVMSRNWIRKTRRRRSITSVLLTVEIIPFLVGTGEERGDVTNGNSVPGGSG